VIFQDRYGDWRFVWLETIERRRDWRKWEYLLPDQA
jgi:hypothetical protein